MDKGEYEKTILYFMFGLITAALTTNYGWWGLISVPIWFIMSHYSRKLDEYKPKQRTIKDY